MTENISEGQYANIGQPVLTLVDDSNWYVLAYFREDLLDRIQPGMQADVALLSYPGKRFHEEVQGVGWGLFQQNGATVAGLPNVEETLNWVRLNQRFPVRIDLKRADSDVANKQSASARLSACFGPPSNSALRMGSPPSSQIFDQREWRSSVLLPNHTPEWIAQ